MEQKGLTFVESQISMIPNNFVDLDEKQTETFEKMLDAFEDNDDVQEVFHNVNLPEEEIEE